MPTATISERTRQLADPVRNFKYMVSFYMDGPIKDQLGQMGFTSVDGLSMSTDVSAYREGGWNTNPHKLPGQTDFAPVSLSSGVFYTKPGMWEAAKQMFSVQWGKGTLAQGADFRFDMTIRVLEHPVTQGIASGSGNKPGSGTYGNTAGSIMAFKIYNGWVANVAYGGLNAGDNGVLIHSMTVHHEGLEVIYGNAAEAT